MEKNININYWVNNENYIDYSDHEDALKESVQERIFEMLQVGCNQGELSASIDGMEYSGWFTIKVE